MAIDFFQRVGDWYEQRREYRQAALKALRKREGLPSPVDRDGNELETCFDDQGNAHYYNQAGKRVDQVLWQGYERGQGKQAGGFAIGSRKGEARELADASWHRPDAEFEILDVAEDGRKLSDELADLDRDAGTMEIAEKVSHGTAGEQAPELRLDGTSDEEIDETLQKFLKRGL